MQEASEVFGAKPVPAAQFLGAAQYVRMSTENQQNSTENQSDVILSYVECGSRDTSEAGDADDPHFS
jgi:hypothetical protein